MFVSGFMSLFSLELCNAEWGQKLECGGHQDRKKSLMVSSVI